MTESAEIVCFELQSLYHAGDVHWSRLWALVALGSVV